MVDLPTADKEQSAAFIVSGLPDIRTRLVRRGAPRGVVTVMAFATMRDGHMPARSTHIRARTVLNVGVPPTPCDRC